MNIGVVCYASVGGSGIVATELAKSLARRGHQVHLISTEPPFRLGDYEAGLAFHRVHTPSYPLFREPQYLLSLANKIVQLSREFTLDIVHAHYAIPHATAAYLAKQILAATNGGPDAKVPKVITTLHGTDITLLGSDPSYSETVAFSIDQSDGVTAVSDSLRRDTYRGAADQARHPRHSELSRVRRAPAPRAAGSARAAVPARQVRQADHSSVELPARQARRRRRGDLRAGAQGRAREADLRRRRSGARTRDAHGARARAGLRRRGARRTGSGRAAAVGLRSLPPAVGAGKLRPGRARSDGLRGAGGGVARRRIAGGRRGRRGRISVRA